jgi:hypothetical protein
MICLGRQDYGEISSLSNWREAERGAVHKGRAKQNYSAHTSAQSHHLGVQFTHLST